MKNSFLKLAIFKRLKSYIWLVPTVLDSAETEHRTEFYRKFN